MAKFIKIAGGQNLIEFDKGSFDEWCVYLTKKDTIRYAPKDIEYFESLKCLGNIHGHAHIYNTFLQFYLPTDKELNSNILSQITTISNDFGKDATEIDTWFTVIYAGMVAEENKANAILKKRIKRLGMHQLLLENQSAEFAASFSKGKKWQELNGLMKQRGF